MTKLAPLICANPLHDVGDGDEVIHNPIPCTDTSRYIAEGWMITSNVLYSYDGTNVVICPECAAEYKVLRREMLDSLIESKRKFRVEYLNCADITQATISQFDNLRSEFVKYEPAWEDWQSWGAVDD